MKVYGYASQQLLFKAMNAGKTKLTIANLKSQEANAMSGGSVAYHLVRSVLLDRLPFEQDDPEAEDTATLMAFTAIVSGLEDICSNGRNHEVEIPNADSFGRVFHQHLELAKPYFLLDAWSEAMGDDAWEYHHTKDYVLSEEREKNNEKRWVQKGDRKIEISKMQEVIVRHLSDLIEFQIRKLALYLSENVSMEQWLNVFDLPDTPTDRRWVEKRLNIVLHH